MKPRARDFGRKTPSLRWIKHLRRLLPPEAGQIRRGLRAAGCHGSLVAGGERLGAGSIVPRSTRGGVCKARRVCAVADDEEQRGEAEFVRWRRRIDGGFGRGQSEASTIQGDDWIRGSWRH